MQFFRIARTEFICDLSGAGSRLYGGRWNRKGTALVYTSESRALAALEYLVHVPMALAPTGLSILRIDVPDDIKARTIDATTLPRNWRAYPPPQDLAAIGTKWALSNETLLLRVPSVVVEDEFNVLINPSHHEFKRIRSRRPEPFVLDQRLLGQKTSR
jgi:RES domain-containing protein